MPRKKSKPQQRQRGGGDAAAFFSEAGNISRLGADKTSSPSKSVGQENETLSCGPTLCLSTLSETGTGGGRCRLRRWPVLLPFADKSAAIFATPEHYRICEKGQEESVLMESLPASEIEEFLNFFKQKDLIANAVKMGLISLDIVNTDGGRQPCVDLSIADESICRYDDGSENVLRVLHRSPPLRLKRQRLLLEILTIFQPGLRSSTHEYASLSGPKPSFDALYDIVQSDTLARRNITLEDRIQPGELLAQLRPYQQHALSWALGRERQPSIALASSTHGWWEVETDSEGVYFYNQFNGVLMECSDDSYFRKPTVVRGGILADEMGLGKTIETMGLILSNPRPHFDGRNRTATGLGRAPRAWKNETFECVCSDEAKAEALVVCRSCGAKVHASCNGGSEYFEVSDNECLWCVSKTQSLFTLKCTLIVCPMPIINQWVNELNRHIKDSEKVRILVYQGVSGEGRKLVKKCSQVGREDSIHRTIIHPLQFENFDIVLTTYSVLRSELHHANIVRRNSKFKKRFPPVPSPLVSVQWWRICLDEAQMVENSTAKAAAMALKLAAVNRWCISGTPFVRGSGLDDLYGLMLFLQVQPWGTDQRWFKHGLQRLYEGGREVSVLRELLHNVMWRSAKKDVKDEIRLAPLTEMSYRLKFSDTEKHFYKRQKEECSELASKILVGLNCMTEQIGRDAIRKVAIPLLRLRQACCHPQVGSFGITPLQDRKALPMNEILNKLIEQAKEKCNIKLKDVVLFMQGTAALLHIQRRYQASLDMYREVLVLLERESSNYKIDRFQKLHALHNCCATAEIWRSEFSRAGEADPQSMPMHKPLPELRSEAASIKGSLAAAQNAAVMYWLGKLNTTTHNFLDNERKVSDKRRELAQTFWWDRALSTVYSNPALRRQFQATIGGMLNTRPEYERIGWQHTHVTGLGYILGQKIEKLESERRYVIHYLIRHSETPTDTQVRERGNCSRCSSIFNRTGPVCFHCKAEERLLAYNEQIYSYRIGSGGAGSSGNGNINKNSYRGDSVLYRVLRTLAQCIRGSRPDLYREAKIALGGFELLKLELANAQHLFSAISQHLATLDELETCTTRMRLRFPGETVSPEDAKWKLLPIEVVPELQRMKLERAVADTELASAKSQLRFLLNVQEKEAPGTEGQTSQSALGKHRRDEAEPSDNGSVCPICCETMTEKVILHCAHIYCYSCIKKLVKKRERGKLKCPYCRQHTDITRICKVAESSVSGPSGAASPITTPRGAFPSAVDDTIQLAGSYGTKIEAVLKVCKSILKQNPDSKMLIFSQWDEVLDIAEQAFFDNTVPFVRLQGSGKKLHTRLSMFKSDPTVSALLLPTKSGANGLNLTEANHCLFIDPIMTKAVEDQAIGRIWRIGQIRETFVHRFIVTDTIEERIDMLQRESTNRSRSRSAKTKSVKEDAQLTGEELQLLFEE
jgi:E3 ubiquitin-protein ligase SHPRH